MPPIVSVKVEVKDNAQRYWDLIRELEEIAVHVDIGIHPVSGDEMVMIASSNEFGATIQNPGGQPFFITADPKWRDVPNAAPLSDGKMIVFRAKGKPGAQTKPHEIEIPARPFIRSTVDEKRDKYAEVMTKAWQKILDGEIGIQEALVLIGHMVERDVKDKITAIDTPKNADSTIRQKFGVDNPLIDTSAMKNSIRYAVKNIHETTVELGPGG